MCSNVANGENAERATKRNNFQKLQGQHSKEIVLFAMSSYKRRLGTVCLSRGQNSKSFVLFSSGGKGASYNGQ